MGEMVYLRFPCTDYFILNIIESNNKTQELIQSDPYQAPIPKGKTDK